MNAADPRDARIAELERLLSAALARIEQQDARIAELEARIAELEACIAELEAQWRSTSRTVSFRQACVMLGALLGRLGHGAERQVWRGTACEARRALAAASGGLRPRSREWDRRGGDAQVAVPSFSSAWR